MAARGALTMQVLCGVVLLRQVAFAAASAASHLQPAAQTSAINSSQSSIRKVITLIEEMKVQVEKETKGDLDAYDKYMCWCETNDKEKTAAIADAAKRIEELGTFLEEAAAKEGELKTEVAGLESDIAEDQDALATASGIREKDLSTFLAAEADMKESKGLLQEAVAVLSKVQLLQSHSSGRAAAVQSRAHAVLLQLRDVLRSRSPRFQGVMQRDLFDVLGSLEDFPHPPGFLPKRSAASFEQARRLLPWEKTEEQLGMEAKPNELKGAAASAKSHDARSGGILGVLAEMSEEFARDLADAQTADFKAEVSFQSLRAAKLAEIEVATGQKERKEAELADLLDKAAKAKEDREATAAAMEADQGFLANLKKDCQVEDEQYKQRVKVRGDEAVALGETLTILREDGARELFGKTVSFLQLAGGAARAGALSAAGRAAAEDRAAERAMQRIAAVARKHGNWALVSLAVRVRLDAFTKVKEAMDKMLAELQKQQKEEYEKSELCKKAIDETEDSIKVGENTKEDLGEKHLTLVNTLEALRKDIEGLRAEEEEMKVSLKQAGEQRKAQNELFQTSVMDQRATSNILEKALTRLQQFYTPALVEVQARGRDLHAQPGRPVAPPPPKPQDYQKSGASGGVIQLLMKIISVSKVAEGQLHQDEQRSQELYADFVKAATATIEADRAAIEEKSAQAAEAESAKSETEGAQLANTLELSKLVDLLKAHHVDCDYVLKYFDMRQQARQEEMEAITDAKAVLSGAGFGK